MLRTLLAKDLRRARRNPLPWVIFLLVPLCTVALIGLAFAPRSQGEAGLGRIRFGVVDEDRSLLGRFLRGSGSYPEAAKYLEPVPLERAAALAELADSRLSAVVVVPAGFTRDFLRGAPVRLELIKNPAESIKPTALEELLGVLVAALNGLGRNFAPDLAAWHELLNRPAGDQRGLLDFLGDAAERERLTALFDSGGRKLAGLRGFLQPPLVGYTTPPPVAGARAESRGPGFSLFGYLLLGLGAMFLLFLGGAGMGDLHREVDGRTLARFQTVRVSLVPFLGAKVVFALVMLLACAAILFGGGGLIFGVTWRQPLPLFALTLAYALFIAGLMAAIVAWLPDQRKSDAIRTMAGMILGLAGGCAFPPDQLPPFYREHLMPWLPTHWFAATARALEFGGPSSPWPLAAGQLLATGLLLLALAAWLFRRRFLQEGRP